MRYHACFGGELHIETFEQQLVGFTEKPVVRAVLYSPKLMIQGSDLVHNEGRRVGNYMAILVTCSDHQERSSYVEQLLGKTQPTSSMDATQPLLEIVDRFDVRWVFSV